ncbi:hypothetical protein F2Q69_00030175 [Brassica cretica]|uniref:Uncharacterized protein n=1 Tax=Brassica cretica TaxID=69181 RepID=A0A8S9S6K7_BRACR|nr:hypothetical protein F2Q69_00030175 [Brassica cretica]
MVPSADRGSKGRWAFNADDVVLTSPSTSVEESLAYFISNGFDVWYMTTFLATTTAMKSTGKSPVSTYKSPIAMYINDVSPGPADCKRLDRSENRSEAQTPKKLGASTMEIHCYKALHPYPFEHDDICSCMLHRRFTIAGTQTRFFRSSGLSVTYVSQ